MTALSGLVLARTVIALSDLGILEEALAIAERAKRRERKTPHECPYSEQDLRDAKAGDDMLNHVIRWATDSRSYPAIAPEDIDKARSLLRRAEVEARVIHLAEISPPVREVDHTDWRSEDDR